MSTSLSVVAAAFTADLSVHGRAVRTIADHARILRVLAGWLEMAGLDWVSVRGAQLAPFLRRRSIARPAAVFNEISTLRVFYRWAVEMEYRPDNPTLIRAFRTPKKGAPYPRALSIEQVRDLCAHLRAHVVDGPRPHRDYVLVLLALYTGLRAAELAALTWDDVQWAEQGVIVQAGKGNKGRWVRLHPDLPAVLRSWRVRQGHAGEGAILSVEQARPVLPNQIGRTVRRYARLLHLPGLTTHALRHTFATQAVRRSGNVRSVSRALGHGSLAYTERYLRPATDDSQAAVDSLPEIGAW